MQFVIGGLSGITFAAAPIDWQVTDTYYVVAHFHYVLFGGTVFAVFAGDLLLVSQDDRAALSRALGKAHFWLTVVGFNLTFFVQHFLGIMGMPRRVFTYPDLPGWGALNMASTIGAFILGVSVSCSRSTSLQPAARRRSRATTRGTPGRSSGRRPRRRLRTTSSACRRCAAGARCGTWRTPPRAVRRPPATKPHPGQERRRHLGVHRLRRSFFVVLILSYVFFNLSTSRGRRRARRKDDGHLHGVSPRQQRHALSRGESARRRETHAARSARGSSPRSSSGASFIVGQASEYLRLFEAA